MEVAVDLHIHSGLSPCADNTMTPNNIINMALLKKLDVLAITDHNSTKNLSAFLNIANKKGIICIPGIEITTKEEVHLTALFPSLDNAQRFQKIVDAHLPRRKNNASFFGNQLIFKEDDSVKEEEEILLSNALTLSIEDSIDEIRKAEGIPIAAHIDKDKFSIISNLGFIDKHLELKVIEFGKNTESDIFVNKHAYLSAYTQIKSSDAHYLGDILEREFFLDVESKSIEGVLNALEV
ncbi:PHP domain-containing protein [Serpentinicella sp. ANB-PHB4]|uniref:PHP domain-containing protein n=1 Tax=Serpentinicella sp. ANB-PHB4 TaxID=3074076 RepID=UPI00286234F6|nr:PHP domain-containing protein [Serpentinicella sp. ANB-PHB4]MDR5657875.1 PHP domain-containing protein [Serpentinicella sp. ANB-PHB4]